MGTLSVTPKIASNEPDVTPVKSNLGRLYDLHEYDPDKLATGAINPDLIDPVTYPVYDKNYKGIVVIDKNNPDVSVKRSLINLTTAKPSNKKFNEVVDIEIQEFTETLNSDTTFLANRIAALESVLQRSRADKNTLSTQVDELNRQIDSLRTQLETTSNVGQDNEVGDTLSAGKFLWADRKGNPGDPGYPLIENMLLSKNRTARAIIQSDGNFVVSTGTYDTRGNVLSPETYLFVKGWDNAGTDRGLNSENSVAFAWVRSSQVDGQFEVGRSGNGVWFVNYGSGGQKISNAARLQLSDAGILNLFDGPNLIWSSYGA